MQQNWASEVHAIRETETSEEGLINIHVEHQSPPIDANIIYHDREERVVNLYELQRKSNQFRQEHGIDKSRSDCCTEELTMLCEKILRHSVLLDTTASRILYDPFAEEPVEHRLVAKNGSFVFFRTDALSAPTAPTGDVAPDLVGALLRGVVNDDNSHTLEEMLTDARATWHQKPVVG